MFNTLLYQPFLNSLIWLYDFFGGNLGLAIIVFTIVIKSVLAWPSASFIRSQKKIQALQPRLQALKQKYKGDREGLSKATMALYKESKVNPFTSCLPTLIQLPILFALYRVFLTGLRTDVETGLLLPDQIELLYHPLREVFASTPINTLFFPGFDLAQSGVFFGSVVIALLAGGAQFWQSRMVAAPPAPKVEGAGDERMAAFTGRQMTYLFPLITVVIILSLPIGLGLYWLTSIAFTIVQQYLILRKVDQQGVQHADQPPTNP